MRFSQMIAALALTIVLCGCAQPAHKTLLVFSYHRDYAWVQQETCGAKDVLKDADTAIKKIYLDTKRKTSPEWMAQAAADAAKVIEQYNPDVVIVFDDNACELVAKKYAGKAIPFVFAGMNREPADYGFPCANVTGVVERHQYKESVELLQRIVPGVKKILILGDDSPSGRAYIAEAKAAAMPVDKCETITTNDFAAWQAKVKEAQTTADAIGIVVYHTLKGGDAGQSLPAEQVLEWTLKNNKLPDFSVNDFCVRDGMLCGVVLSGHEQGRAAAEMAVQILNGAKPADIPVGRAGTGYAMVNTTRAKALGLTIPQDVLDEVEVVR
jgi:ABC-type uncharacterized transport system substrate-binding protein